MGYILTTDLNDIIDYCKSRCKATILNHNKSNIKYYRGMYKGYMYGISISKYFKTTKTKLTHAKLYHVIKEEKNKIQFTYIKDADIQKGLLESLYDLMNYVSKQN